MGEIGISPDRFRYGLRWWEARSIIRGYNRRARHLWSATRWQTYNLMCVSMANIKRAGIYRPTDLIKFPWERDVPEGGGNMPTKSEVEEMRRMMMEENARAEQESKKEK